MLLMCGAAAMLGFSSSCSDGKGHGVDDILEKNEGTVSFRAMALDVNVESLEETGRAADNSVDVSNFIVELLRDDDATTVGSWSFSQMPDIQILPVGDYTVNVMSHQVKPAAFEEPLYCGSESFTIKEAEVHNVGTIVCSLSNVKVTVKYSDILASMMDTEANVVVGIGAASLTFGATESRSGYFELADGANSLVATFTGTIAGRKESQRKVLTDIKAGHHYILTYTVKTGGFISANEGVQLNASIDGVDINFELDPDDELLDDSDRPGGDNGEDPNPPVGAETITFSSSMLSFTENNPTSVSEAVVLIHADNGIASLKVDIESDDLTDEFLSSVGLAAHFDLAEPGELAGPLSGLGFPVGDEVKGRTDITFDITQFMPLLNIYKGVHKFNITVTDSKGESDGRVLSFIVE